MYLAAAEERSGLIEAVEALASGARWEHFPYSCLSHHGADCCEVAREWMLAMDFAQLNGGDPLAGPRWLRQKYEWGPSPWPIHWCEAVTRKAIDCGAHAALAHEAFAARGVASHRAQLVQRYSADAADQWRRKWGAEKVSDHWITDDLIYHEGNAVLVGDDEVKLWDASAGAWLDPRQVVGYGSLAAVRIFAEGEGPLRWAHHLIERNRWVEMGAAAAPTAPPRLLLRK